MRDFRVRFVGEFLCRQVMTMDVTVQDDEIMGRPIADVIMEKLRKDIDGAETEEDVFASPEPKFAGLLRFEEI